MCSEEIIEVLTENEKLKKNLAICKEYIEKLDKRSKSNEQDTIETQELLDRAWHILADISE